MDEKGLKERIVNEIKEIYRDSEDGFEVFVILKSEPEIKRFILYEGPPKQRNNV